MRQPFCRRLRQRFISARKITTSTLKRPPVKMASPLNRFARIVEAPYNEARRNDGATLGVAPCNESIDLIKGNSNEHYRLQIASTNR